MDNLNQLLRHQSPKRKIPRNKKKPTLCSQVLVADLMGTKRATRVTQVTMTRKKRRKRRRREVLRPKLVEIFLQWTVIVKVPTLAAAE